jgi:hypothetical protein
MEKFPKNNPEKSEFDKIAVMEKIGEADSDGLRQIAAECLDANEIDLSMHIMSKVKRVEHIQYRALNEVLDESEPKEERASALKDFIELMNEQDQPKVSLSNLGLTQEQFEKLRQELL